jgi:hypothetical protein
LPKRRWRAKPEQRQGAGQKIPRTVLRGITPTILLASSHYLLFSVFNIQLTQQITGIVNYDDQRN